MFLLTEFSTDVNINHMVNLTKLDVNDIYDKKGAQWGGGIHVYLWNPVILLCNNQSRSTARINLGYQESVEFCG